MAAKSKHCQQPNLLVYIIVINIHMQIDLTTQNHAHQNGTESQILARKVAQRVDKDNANNDSSDPDISRTMHLDTCI